MDEELGAEFESAVFGKIRQCANNCYFCFVDQVAPNMRDSLYIKMTIIVYLSFMGILLP